MGTLLTASTEALGLLVSRSQDVIHFGVEAGQDRGDIGCLSIDFSLLMLLLALG